MGADPCTCGANSGAYEDGNGGGGGGPVCAGIAVSSNNASPLEFTIDDTSQRFTPSIVPNPLDCDVTGISATLTTPGGALPSFIQLVGTSVLLAGGELEEAL